MHEVAVGPMASVVQNLSTVPEGEVRAIATYIGSLIGPPDPERKKRAEQIVEKARAWSEASPEQLAQPPKKGRENADADVRQGAVVYAGSCAICHGAPQRPPGSPSSNALHLSLSTSLSLSSPDNLLRIIVQGVAPADGERGPFMPGFSGAFTDAQLATLVSYLRATYTDRPAWPDVARDVRKVRESFAQARE
jgi:mono/diheme cytochrome c family protein